MDTRRTLLMLGAATLLAGCSSTTNAAGVDTPPPVPSTAPTPPLQPGTVTLLAAGALNGAMTVTSFGSGSCRASSDRAFSIDFTGTLGTRAWGVEVDIPMPPTQGVYRILPPREVPGSASAPIVLFGTTGKEAPSGWSSTEGTITVDAGGRAGHADATLYPQPGAGQGAPLSVHIAWSCPGP